MRFVKEHMATIVAGLAVAVVLAVAFVLFWPHAQAPGTSLTAVIHDGNGGEQRLPLSTNTSVEVVTSLGRNVVVVDNGTARMAEADCPHGSCMQQHPISQPGEQIICMPHKLWVEVVTEGSNTGTLDTSAVAWNDGQSSNSNNDVDLVAR